VMQVAYYISHHVLACISDAGRLLHFPSRPSMYQWCRSLTTFPITS